MAEEQLEVHRAAEAGVRDVEAVAGAAAATAIAAIDDDLAGLAARRDEAREEVDASLRSRYDRLRDHHVVAVADLVGRQCSGCHLELSAAEVDDVKDEAAAAGGVATCPQCGRMLVI